MRAQKAQRDQDGLISKGYSRLTSTSSSVIHSFAPMLPVCWAAQVLQMSLRLPPPEQMAALTRWMAATMALIDTLGQCKLTPEQKV